MLISLEMCQLKHLNAGKFILRIAWMLKSIVIPPYSMVAEHSAT